MRLKAKSLETLFNRVFVFLALLVVFLLCTLFLQNDSHALTIITVITLVFVPFYLLFVFLKHRVFSPFYTLSAILEAIRNEDYSLRANHQYQHGAAKILAEEVTLMSEQLHQRKVQYDQHSVLVINLINQLAMPVALFDDTGCIEHANDAFSSWLGHPWQNNKGCDAASVGLTATFHKNVIDHWQFVDPNMQVIWQLKFSQFAMQSHVYHLVILSNIEKVVSETERRAWQRMTRVLSHEINNSLAPIQSLAQSVLTVLESSDDKQFEEPMSVILSRSQGLMQFVNRYNQLNMNIDTECELIEMNSYLSRVIGLFDANFEVNCTIELINVDPVLLEQVLVNLVKNAIEAGESKQTISISAKSLSTYHEIKIIDEGVGIANVSNLFVPFYTTKAAGNGIGLALCRNIIDTMGGRIYLKNRVNQPGAIATIILPI